MQPQLSDLVPIGELRPDVAGPFNPFARTAKNCIAQGPDYIPIESLTDAGLPALPSTCRGAVAVKDKSGNVHMFAATSSKLYKLNGAQWADVTRDSGDYSLPDEDRWVFAAYGDRVMAADFADDTQYFDLGLSDKFAALPNAPRCKSITVVNNFVMMGNTFDAIDDKKPRRVRWSGLDNTEAWTPSPTTQSDFQDLENGYGEVKAIVGYADHTIIIQEKAITRAEYVGSPLVFNIAVAEPNQGTVGGNTVVAYGNRIGYLAEDGFYMFDGTQSVPIGYGKIDRTFLKDVKPGSYPKITATYNPLRKIFAWAYISNTGGTTCNKLLVYNWVEQKWTTIEENVEQAFISLQTGKTIEDLGNEYGNLEDVPLSLDSPVYAGGSTLPAVFTSDHKLAFWNGSAMDAEFETGEARLNENGRAFVSSALPITDSQTTTVNLITRALPNASEVVGPSLPLSTATGEFAARSDAMFHRARVGVSDWSYIRGLQFRVRAGGVR